MTRDDSSQDLASADVPTPVSDHVDAEAIRWTSVCRQALMRFSELFQPIFAAPSAQTSDERLWVWNQLAFNCSLTSDSALALLDLNRLWHAEILLRSVVEGTIKFAYLCDGDDALQCQRAKEYWHVLPDLSALRRHDRAIAFLEMVDDPDSSSWRPIRDVVLSTDEVERIRTSHPRAARHALEQHWQFHRMLDALAVSQDQSLSALSALAHNYGMSSHFIHQDGDAIGMVWDRATRDAVRQLAVERAHLARLAADCIIMAFTRVRSAYRGRQLALTPVLDLLREYEVFFAELSLAQEAWHAIEYPREVDP